MERVLVNSLVPGAVDEEFRTMLYDAIEESKLCSTARLLLDYFRAHLVSTLESSSKFTNYKNSLYNNEEYDWTFIFATFRSHVFENVDYADFVKIIQVKNVCMWYVVNIFYFNKKIVKTKKPSYYNRLSSAYIDAYSLSEASMYSWMLKNITSSQLTVFSNKRAWMSLASFVLKHRTTITKKFKELREQNRI